MSAVKHFKRLDSFYKNERLWQNEGNVTLLNATRDSLTMLEMDPMNKSPSEYPIPIIYKRYFKKLPQWTFEDIYNLDAPPRSTVSLVRHKRGKKIKV